MSTKRPPTKRAKLAPPTGKKQLGYETNIDSWRVLFERTRDPFDLWTAYGLHRVLGFPLPAWILSEFDAIVARLGVNYWAPKSGVLDRSTKGRLWMAVIVEAFGFPHNPHGGIQDPVNRWIRHSRDIRLTYAVRELVADGYNETNAFMIVAGKQKVSERTVRRAWREFASIIRLVTLRTDPTSR